MKGALAQARRIEPSGRDACEGLDRAERCATGRETGVPRFLSGDAVQAKLEVGAVDDPMERDADAFALAVQRGDRVLPRFLSKEGRHGAQDPHAGDARRQTGNFVASPTQLSALRPALGRDSPRHDAIAQSRATDDPAPDSGAPLAAPVRTRIEGALGLDLGAVRVHTGPGAEQAAARLQARAFTRGSDIWLGARHAPDELGLMAHEVAHVVQQGGAPTPVRRSPETAQPGSDPSPARRNFTFSEEDMEARLAATPPEGADTSAPTVEVESATTGKLDEVERQKGEGGEGGEGGGGGAEGGGEGAGGGDKGQAGEEQEAVEGGSGGRQARALGGEPPPVPPPTPVPGPASEFESLVAADVAAYLDGNLSSERLAALDPQTRSLLEAVDLLGDRQITDPEASALQALGGEALRPGAAVTGYEVEPLWLRTLANVRDITGQLGGIVGVIGLVATVSGFILSLLIPPVGAFLLTVGRFCDVAALILDAISLVLGIVLTGYNLYRLKNETDPEERRRLLGMVRQDAMGTVMSAVAVATAVAPGAGRALGRAGRRVSGGLRAASRAPGALGRGARAIRSVGAAGRLAGRAGRRGVRAAGRAAASGFRRLSRSSSLAGRAARGLRVAAIGGRRALGSGGRAARGGAMRALGWARGTSAVRWANRLGGQAEEWTRRRLRGVATADTALGRFYNRRLRGIHERNVMVARSINDPVERAYQLRLGRELTDELDALRQANPGWNARQIDDALRARFGRERMGHAEVGTGRGGTPRFVRDDADFLREVRETEFAEIQLVRDRLPPGATPRELADAVNSSPFIKGRWTEEELRAFTQLHPTRRAGGGLALRDAAGEALAVSKTGHHTLPASMAPQISHDPRFIQIVNDSRSYRNFIDNAFPGLTHVPEVRGYRVPGARAGRTRQALNRREVIEDMLDRGQIPGYTRADINYFMGGGLADDLVVDGSSGVWRNRRVAGQRTFFNPHLGIGHGWDWQNELARQIFDMNSRLGIGLRRELGSQLLLPAVKRSGRLALGTPEPGAGDARTHALIDRSISVRTQLGRGSSPATQLAALLPPLAADENPLAAQPLPGGEMAPPSGLGVNAAESATSLPIPASAEAGQGDVGRDEPEAPPAPVPYSPAALVSIREQRAAIADALEVVSGFITDSSSAEQHNRAAHETAAGLKARNAEQGAVAQAERATVAGEELKLDQAAGAQQNMAAENARASGEADRGEGEAQSVQAEGSNVSVEPKPEEPRKRSWLERAWDATAGALWDNLIAPAVRAVRRKVNQVMQSINEFIMNMINQALGLDEIEAELNHGGDDIAQRNQSLHETDAGLQETQDVAVAEAERNQQSMDQAGANIADARTTRADAQSAQAALLAQDQTLLAEESQGRTWILDFGVRYQPFFAPESAGAGSTVAAAGEEELAAGAGAEELVPPAAEASAAESGPGVEEASDESALA